MHYLPPLRLRRQLYWIRVMTGLTMALIVAVGVYLNWGSTIWPEPTVQNYDQVERRGSGLHCPIWCPVRVGTLLDPIPGVHEVLVDVTHARVTVRYDGDHARTPVPCRGRSNKASTEYTKPAPSSTSIPTPRDLCS